MKKTIIAIFMVLIYLPAMLFICSKIFDRSFDVELKGYTEEVSEPEFAFSSFVTGEFQQQFNSWFNDSFKSHGFYTKICQSINYYLFHTGVKQVGGHNSIFEDVYIQEPLALGDAMNFSDPNNQATMQEFVNRLELLNQKLNEHGKLLYVYTVPGKGDLQEEDIPWYYRSIADSSRINAGDYFESLLDETSVPHFYAEEMASDLTYPAFYPAGIHWSRTYEQLVTNELINQLSSLTGNNYRTVNLSEVESNTTGFWRDTDVLDIMNVWSFDSTTYYQYKTSAIYPESFDHLRILFYGDSFAQGLTRDLERLYPYEDIYYVNYDNYVRAMNEPMVAINHDFSSFDYGYYLDRIDVVVIEMVNPLITQYTCGFVDNLILYLDNYESDSRVIATVPYVDTTTINSSIIRTTNTVNGADLPVYGAFVYGEGTEDAAIWSSNYSVFKIQDDSLNETGIRVSLSVPELIRNNVDELTGYIYVNGELQFAIDMLTTEGVSDFNISGDELVETSDGIYEVELIFSNYVVPSSIGEAQDNNSLSCQVVYIGGIE